jgi:hypothetical protein
MWIVIACAERRGGYHDFATQTLDPCSVCLLTLCRGHRLSVSDIAMPSSLFGELHACVYGGSKDNGTIVLGLPGLLVIQHYFSCTYGELGIRLGGHLFQNILELWSVGS